VAKDRRSRDQKRKAKLAVRARKQKASEDLTPYEGKKYQADEWAPHVFRTEEAIHEAVVLSRRQLTNEQVRSALHTLIKQLRAGTAPVLAPEEPEVAFQPGNEVEFLVWNIRRFWGMLFQERGPVAIADLVGILRTLLYSIEAHAWNTGPERGYVDFLDGFMRRMS
jgi:hypothetical protein